MTDEEQEHDEYCDDYEAAQRVGAKVIEAAERVKVAHAALPGSQAVWNFSIENTRFEVTMKVASAEGSGT